MAGPLGIPVLDTFSGSGPLGAPNWTARPYVSGSTTATDPPVVSGGQLVSPDDDDLYYEAWWSAESLTGEHGVFATLATDGRELFRLWLCLSSPGVDNETDGYVLEFDYSGDVDSLHVYRVTNDGFAQLGATISQELDAGDGLGLTTDGETLTVWHLDASGSGEWASIATRDDSTYTSGYIGVGINRTSGDPGPGLDNFGGGPVPEPPTGGIWVNEGGVAVRRPLYLNVAGEAVEAPILQAST